MSEETPKKIKPIPILLDEPVGHSEDSRAELGFEEYADVLAGVILGSDSPFTVGIFGDWGTGKTTLMRCIERKLKSPDRWDIEDPKPTIIPVWFEAWRYEREDDLIAPLLGEIADAIRDRANESWWPRLCTATHDGFRAALATTVFSGEVGGIGAEVDAEKLALRYEQLSRQLGVRASSKYREAYAALEKTLEAFAKREGGGSRIVVFVDDLDRCLPEAAVKVLEATKVFLGFEGMVFVLGLKRDVIEASIWDRYCKGQDAAAPVKLDSDLGRNYIDKLVQIPFSLPPATYSDIIDFGLKTCPDVDLMRDMSQTFRPTGGFASAEPYASFAELGEAGCPQIANVVQLPARFLPNNPRLIKRVLNVFILSATAARRNLERSTAYHFDPSLMMTLVVLRFLDGDTYERLMHDLDHAEKMKHEAAAALGLPVAAGRPPDDPQSREHTDWEEGASEYVLQAEHCMPMDVARLLLQTRLPDTDPILLEAHARSLSLFALVRISVQPGRDDRVWEAHELLQDADPERRAYGLHLIGKFGTAYDVETVAKLLKDTDKLVRREAAEAIARIGSAVGLPHLRQALEDPDPEVRWAAAVGFSYIPSRDCIKPLLKALEDDDAKVRAAAARSLGENRATTTDALIERLADEEGNVRWAAGEAIGRIRPEGVVPRLMEMLGDDDWRARHGAAFALGCLRVADAVDALMQAAQDEEHHNPAAAAVWALGHIGPSSEAALPLLRRLLESGPRLVRERAEEAIEKIQAGVAERQVDQSGDAEAQ